MKTLLYVLLCLVLMQACGQKQQAAENTASTTTSDPTADWLVYEDKSSGFSFRYPKELQPNPSDDQPRDLSLRVTSTLIDQLEEEEPLGYDKATALKDQQALSQKQFGEDIDEPLEASREVISVGGVPAKKFMVLSRFDVCSTTFERVLVFYHRDRQIVLNLSSSAEVMGKEMPTFFKKDEACGEDLVWNFEKQDDFYKALAQHKGGTRSQQWFDLFDKIAGTIRVEESK